MSDNYDCALTTKDNPFDPFEDFIQWYLFDVAKGYNCCSRLDRIANFSDDLSQVETSREKERAIDEIILNDDANIYKKCIKQLSVV